jgi:hypothetical protein
MQVRTSADVSWDVLGGVRFGPSLVLSSPVLLTYLGNAALAQGRYGSMEEQTRHAGSRDTSFSIKKLRIHSPNSPTPQVTRIIARDKRHQNLYQVTNSVATPIGPP